MRVKNPPSPSPNHFCNGPSLNWINTELGEGILDILHILHGILCGKLLSGIIKGGDQFFTPFFILA